MTQTEQRTPQTLDGDTLPLNVFIGREECEPLEAMIAAFSETGINLLALPLITEIQQAIADDNLETGAVIGCKTPISEHEPAQVVIWDGYWISAMSLKMYQMKVEEDWDISNRVKPDVNKENELTLKKQNSKKKVSEDTKKHREESKRKARNSRGSQRRGR